MGLSQRLKSPALDTRRKVVSLWRKAFFHRTLAGLQRTPRPVAPGLFPPRIVVQIKALACELPSQIKVPAGPMERAGKSPAMPAIPAWWPTISGYDRVALAAPKMRLRLGKHRCWNFPPSGLRRQKGRVLTL